MADLKSIEPAATLDVLGRVCPYPLVLTKKKLEKLNSGEVLKVISDAQASVEDSIPKYCEKHGYEMETVKLEDKGYWEIYIQKK
ncbi:sulfurtransferase TusA [bacterium BMS3Bbin07]|nr:sulfurtransferase TusA family protein [Nitrospirota bacterium]GBE36610.1 sulfurtransferase TusA [bacterium BMS3Bbin07]